MALTDGNGVAVFAGDRRQLFTDSRYAVRARAQTRGVEVVQAGRDLSERVSASLAKYNIASSEDESTEGLRTKLAQFYADRTLFTRPITAADQA